MSDFLSNLPLPGCCQLAQWSLPPHLSDMPRLQTFGGAVSGVQTHGVYAARAGSAGAVVGGDRRGDHHHRQQH